MLAFKVTLLLLSALALALALPVTEELLQTNADAATELKTISKNDLKQVAEYLDDLFEQNIAFPELNEEEAENTAVELVEEEEATEATLRHKRACRVVRILTSRRHIIIIRRC